VLDYPILVIMILILLCGNNKLKCNWAANFTVRYRYELHEHVMVWLWIDNWSMIPNKVWSIILTCESLLNNGSQKKPNQQYWKLENSFVTEDYEIKEKEYIVHNYGMNPTIKGRCFQVNSVSKTKGTSSCGNIYGKVAKRLMHNSTWWVDKGSLLRIENID